jgi:predicted glycoside hydrolase/deacetylase ChbG (UPF0249 family)
MSHPRRLVVNADDLGLCDGVNRGILRAHAEGIVTSASLMAFAPAAERAVAAAAGHPRLGIGLHVDLGEWNLGANGEWSARYAVVDTSDEAAVVAELERQVERFRELVGREPTHMDSHQHLHREEPVRSAMGRLAKALRVPLRHHGRVRYCGAFYGRDGQGAPVPEAISPQRLAELVAAVPEGATELCCHPAEEAPADCGYTDERRLELAALCDPQVRRAVVHAGVQLRSFATVFAE